MRTTVCESFASLFICLFVCLFIYSYRLHSLDESFVYLFVEISYDYHTPLVIGLNSTVRNMGVVSRHTCGYWRPFSSHLTHNIISVHLDYGIIHLLLACIFT